MLGIANTVDLACSFQLQRYGSHTRPSFLPARSAAVGNFDVALPLRDRSVPWRYADRSSAGLLPDPSRRVAVVRVFAARTESWRGIVATHCWIVVKAALDTAYRRFDYTAWGEPIWVDRFVPDGRWFGSLPKTVFAADGAEADRLVPLILQAIKGYRYPRPGDYRAWPGPNSNTFVAAVMSSVPGINATLPPLL